MTMVVGLVLAVLGGAAIAGTVFFILGRRLERAAAEIAGRTASQQSERILSDAKRSAEAARAEAILSAKEEIIRTRETWETEVQRRREDLERQERRVGE